MKKYQKHTTLEFQQIQDGWEYELDRKGNVKKDTSGNDIKKT